jgi:anti-sigma-K factor RskA
MARGRADLHTLAGPYALNALPGRDRDRFERHLAACDACSQEVHSLQETAARLAGAAAVAPPARLRERVLAEAARTRQAPPEPDSAAERWPRRARWLTAARRRARSARRAWSRPVAVAMAGVFLIVAVVFGTVALITRHTLSQEQARDHMLAAVLTAPDAKMMTAQVTGGGTATIVMSHQAHALAFSSAGLPALPAGQAYELWLMGPPGTRSAAMLPKATHGMTSPVIATGLRTGDTIELTVEPAAGAPAPTTRPILLMLL